MKTYKVKSFTFLCCFIASAIYYYHIEQNSEFQNQFVSGEMVEIDSQELEDETESEELENPQQ